MRDSLLTKPSWYAGGGAETHTPQQVKTVSPNGLDEGQVLGGIIEAVALGFASGPVCLASCGPVLLPWLAAEREGAGATIRLLAVFLGGRLAGYLLFAVLSWTAGLAIPLDAPSHTLVFGAADLLLAAILAVYAWRPRRLCLAPPATTGAQLYQIDSGVRIRRPATAALGLMTGLNLCPPFVAAAVRAAEGGSLPAALLFFLCFFVGTAIWFLPAAAVGSLRRIPAAATVARMVMALIAAYYAYLGLMILSWRWTHA